MHQSIEVASAFLDLLPHIVVDLHVEHICDQIECILVVLHFRVKACEIEAVGEVILVDLAKVLVASR